MDEKAEEFIENVLYDHESVCYSLNVEYLVYSKDKFHTEYSHSDYTITLKNTKNIAEEFFNLSKCYLEASGVAFRYLYEEGMKQSRIEVLDIDFFACAFLYRNAFELILKANIILRNSTDEETKEDIKYVSHSFSKGLEVLEQKVNIKGNKELYKWLEEFFKSIDERDQDAGLFRYPSSGPLDYSDQVHLDIIKFREKLKFAYKVFEILYKDGVDCYIETEPSDYNSIYLEEGGGYNTQAVFGDAYSLPGYMPTIMGYKNIARELLKEIYEHKTIELFLPMMFLFRHYIENTLKDMISNKKHNTKGDLRKLHRHSLAGLWNSMKEVLPKYGIDEDDCDVLEEHIKILHKYDAQGDRFRYPINKELEFNYNKGETIHMLHAGIYMCVISHLIESVGTGYIANRETELEMESEYENQMRSEYY